MKKRLFGLILVIISLEFMAYGKDLGIPKNFEGKYETIEKNKYVSKNIISITKIGRNKYKIKAKWSYDGLCQEYLEETFKIIGVKKDKKNDPTYISYQITELERTKFIKKNKIKVKKNLDWKTGYLKIKIKPKYETNETEILVIYGNFKNLSYFSARKKGIKL